MLRNWRIGTRLGLGFGILLFLMLAVGLSGIRSVQSLHKKINLLVADRMVKVEQAHSVSDNLNIVARALRNLLIDENKEHQAEELRRITDARKIIGERLDILEKTVRDEKGTTLIKQIKESRQTYVRHLETYMELIKKEQNQQAKTLLLSGIREAQRNYLTLLSDFQ